MTRSSILMPLALLLPLVLGGCESSMETLCSPDTCDGVCIEGECERPETLKPVPQSGDLPACLVQNAECGALADGTDCGACPDGATCVSNHCVWSCGPSTCAGCCEGDTCRAGDGLGACGRYGEACTACGAGETCDLVSGTCSPLVWCDFPGCTLPEGTECG